MRIRQRVGGTRSRALGFDVLRADAAEHELMRGEGLPTGMMSAKRGVVRCRSGPPQPRGVHAAQEPLSRHHLTQDGDGARRHRC